MAKPLLAEELWERIEPLLPPEPPKPKGGRPRVPNRQVLSGSCSCCRRSVLGSLSPKSWGADQA